MILHVVKSNIYSGAENVVCQIIKGLSDKEDFIYMSPHGSIEDKLKSIGLYENYYGIEKLDVASIRAAVEKFHPTVVHAHDFTASVLCAFALKNTVPIISHLHNNPPWIKTFNLKTLSYLIACRYFNHILMVSDAVKNEYRYTSKINCPITITGNPFSVDGVRSQVSNNLPSENNNFSSDLLFVGRLTEQKNPLLVLEVAKELASTNLVKKIRIVGDGELFSNLQSYITNNNLNDIVFLEGFKKDPYNYMASTKIQIMPSKWEGFGLVALEAMSLGIPVVGSDNGGLKKIIDSSCGFVCRTKEDYINAITELISNPSTYAEKSNGATKRALEYNNINEYCDTLFKTYKSLL